MNILIVKTSAIGDVTHTLPALNAIRHHYPGARITWLVEEAAADVISGHHALDRVLVSRRRQWIKQWRAGQWRQTLAEVSGFIAKVRDTDYDLLIDFQNLLKSGLFVALAKARRKAGFGRGMEHSECSYLFLNERIAPIAMDIHAVDRELLLLRAIGIEAGEVVFDFPTNTASDSEALNLLAAAGIDRRLPIVAINPIATWESKCWYNDRFTAVARGLIDQGHAVIFTGGPPDHDAAAEMMAGLPPGSAVNFAGRTSLKALASLYRLAQAVISTDTGPMHIAAAVGTPVVALFGPTSPCRTGPYGKGHEVLRAGLACSPCLQRQCTTRQCMQALTPDAVIAAVGRVTAGGRIYSDITNKPGYHLRD